MQSSKSDLTIEISSITNKSTLKKIPLFLRLYASFIASFTESPGGKRKKEWIVWPPTFSAATPVGASTTTFFFEFSFKYFKKVDLPVPARPVMKTLPFDFSSKLNAFSNPSLNSIFSNKTLPHQEKAKDLYQCQEANNLAISSSDIF